MLGVALDHGHRRLEAIQGAPLLRPREQAGEVAAQDGANRGARVAAEQPARQPPEEAGIEARRSAADQLLQELPQMRRKPGDRGELDRVGALVEGDPAQEEARVLAQLAVGGGEIRAHEDQSWLPLRRPQRDVVLSEHLACPVADGDPGLRPRRGPRQPAGDAPERAGEREAVGDLPLELSRELAQRAQPESRPLRAIDELRPRQLAGGTQAGVVERQRHCLGAGGVQGFLVEGARRTVVAPERQGHPLGQPPVDEPVCGHDPGCGGSARSWALSTPASSSRSRAAATW